MKQISSLFEKYKKTLRAPQASVEREVSSVITEVTGFSVPVEQVHFTPATRVVKLQVSSVLRSEIVRRKTEVLQKLKQRIGGEQYPTELL